jgi:hypothetical protein
MQGQEFHGPDHVPALFLDLWHNLDPSTFISVYHDGIGRLEQVIAMKREHYSE